MKNNEKLKLKIKALLNKNTENGASEAEAVAALECATKLMMQYRFTEEEINDPLLGKRCHLKETPLIKTSYKINFFFAELSKLFDCEHFYNDKSIHFFGFDQDPDLCVYFYNTIIRSCQIEVENYKKSKDYKVSKELYSSRSLTSSFAKGYVLRITAKLREMYIQKNSTLETGNALVVKKIKTVKNELKNLNLKIRINSPKLQRATSSAGYNAGLKKGDDFQITQGVTGFRKDTTHQLNK